jgi:hypothetical protein
MDEPDKIELRSEKVRNLIGQMPPFLIRTGLSVIFLIITVLIIGSMYFKFEYTIKTSAIIEPQNEITLIGLKIPANEIKKVKSGNKVILNFDHIPNLYNEKIITEIQAIPNEIEISEKGGFYLAGIRLSEKVKTEAGKELIIRYKTSANAIIITDKINLFECITKRFSENLEQ